MKIWVFVFLLFISSTCFADCYQQAQVSIKFMNQYLTYTQTIENGQHKQSVTDWLKSNKLVAPGFVKA